MNQKEDIIKRLNTIEFHDAPVIKISFKMEDSNDFVIDFALFEEVKNDYDYWTLIFEGIQDLKTGNLNLNSESDLEIFRFDYKFDEHFI